MNALNLLLSFTVIVSSEAGKSEEGSPPSIDYHAWGVGGADYGGGVGGGLPMDYPLGGLDSDEPLTPRGKEEQITNYGSAPGWRPAQAPRESPQSPAPVIVDHMSNYGQQTEPVFIDHMSKDGTGLDSQTNYFMVLVVMFVLCLAYVLSTLRKPKHKGFELVDSDPFKVHPGVIQVYTLNPSDASKQACTK